MNFASAVFYLVIYFAVVVSLFLILRALWLWYFRINEAVSSLQIIASSASSLSSLVSNLSKSNTEIAMKLDIIINRLSSDSILDDNIMTTQNRNETNEFVIQSNVVNGNSPVQLAAIESEIFSFLGLAFNVSVESTDVDFSVALKWTLDGNTYCEYSRPDAPMKWSDIEIYDLRYGFFNNSFEWARFTVATNSGNDVLTFLLDKLEVPAKQIDKYAYWIGRKLIIAFRSDYKEEGNGLTLYFISPKAYAHGKNILRR